MPNSQTASVSMDDLLKRLVQVSDPPSAQRIINARQYFDKSNAPSRDLAAEMMHVEILRQACEAATTVAVSYNGNIPGHWSKFDLKARIRETLAMYEGRIAPSPRNGTAQSPRNPT